MLASSSSSSINKKIDNNAENSFIIKELSLTRKSPVVTKEPPGENFKPYHLTNTSNSPKQFKNEIENSIQFFVESRHNSDARAEFGSIRTSSNNFITLPTSLNTGQRKSKLGINTLINNENQVQYLLKIKYIFLISVF